MVLGWEEITNKHVVITDILWKDFIVNTDDYVLEFPLTYVRHRYYAILSVLKWEADNLVS